MKRKLLCSSGTMVGRLNGYNYIRAMDTLRQLSADGIIDGGELMMLPFYHDKLDDVINSAEGIHFPILHCEKEIGTMISDAAKFAADGNDCRSDVVLGEAFKLFCLNCRVGQKVGAEKMVLHLWGGLNSDSHIKYNISKLPWFIKEAGYYGMMLLIENVPCTTNNPLADWRSALASDPSASFIYDTRFAELHRQSEETLTDKKIIKKIQHIHISDIICDERDFSALRPIYHPGEGQIDFKKSALLLSSVPADTVTLESPVMNDENIDTEKLKSSLMYVGRLFAEK